MLQAKVVEKIKTHILCSVTFTENRAVYEIMSNNFEESERPQITIQRRATCWISKNTSAQAYACAHAPTPTHTQICNTYCFTMATMTRDHAPLLRHTYIACLVDLLFY